MGNDRIKPVKPGHDGWGNDRIKPVKPGHDGWGMSCSAKDGDLGPVDGFDQDEGASKGDECTVAVLGFITTHGNPLEALQLADGLLDSGTRLVEQSWKELRFVLGVLAIRNNRNDAAATAGCPIGR